MRVLRPSLRAAAPVVLLAGSLACGFQDRVQRTRTLQDLKAIEQAAAQGRPLPELASDLSRNGRYRVVLVHFRDGYQRLQSIGKELQAHEAKVAGVLKPESLLSPASRTAHRTEIEAVRKGLVEMRDAMDEVVGPSAEKAFRAMPLDKDFVDGMVKGLEQSRTAGYDTVRQQLERKGVYFAKLEGVLDLVEREQVERGILGTLSFKSKAAADAYNAQIREIAGLEGELGARAQQLQSAQEPKPQAAGPR